VKFLRRALITVVVLAVAGYTAVLGYIYTHQRELQYDAGGKMYALSETKLQHAELVSIPTADGSKLAAWYEPPQAGKPLILYFRGNSESFSREHDR
jgi:dipeptidyl aminopeptidase/acylaminoacyl peptidase